jgi:hypothetical protein
MKKELTKISPDLTIPGFDVKVTNERFCRVTSKDGRYEFSAQVSGGILVISGSMFPKPLLEYIGSWKTEMSSIVYEVTAAVDDAITHVANSLRMIDEFSRDGYSAKIKGNWLVLSHSSKPDYSLLMSISDARKCCGNLYATLEYLGPAYQADNNLYRDWEGNRWEICGTKFMQLNIELDELIKALKARILSMGEPDLEIFEWFPKNLEKDLLPLEFTFTPNLDKACVEFSHPSGLSGSLSFALFSTSRDFPPPKQKAVLFTFTHPDYQKPYLRSWLHDHAPEKTLVDIRQILFLVLVLQEVNKKWKSDILIPKLSGHCLQLVNTRLKNNESIILECTPNNKTLLLKGMGDTLSYPLPDIPAVFDANDITRNIVSRAEMHVQEFLKKTGGNRAKKVPELDF